MTTISYKNGVLVGEGREVACSDDESSVIIRDNCVKVFKLPDGSLFGGAHSSEDIERLFKALQLKQVPPKLDSIAGLRIDKQRRIWLYEGNIWQHITGVSYYAIGSGAVFAIAAMDAGATALEAVKIGIKRDPYSGGKITQVKLDLKAKKKAK